MKQQKKVAELLLWTVLAIILGLVISFAFLPLLGVNPVESLKIMLSETFADKFSMGNILVKTTPLILTSLAFAFTYKANLYNIGAQGQFYVGCICAVAVTLQLQTKVPGPVVLITACLASMIGGGLTGFIIGFLKAKFNANEFLVSMMSTYVITYVMQLLLRTVLQESKHEYLKTDYIDNSAWLPKIINGTSVSLGIVIAVAAAIVIWFILYRTSMGYRIRVMGFTQCMLAFFISGAVAGLAGFTEINGMQHMLLTGLESDIGSYGIGIAIMANANPIGVIFAALLFGTLQVGGTALGHSTDAPASVIDVMLGFVMLFVLMSFFVRKKLEVRSMKKQKIQKGEV